MKRMLWLLLGMWVTSAAMAATESQVAKSIEASMVVTGNIVVTTSGNVQNYTLDHQDKLPPAVVQIVKKTVALWKFEPVLVDGKPAIAKASMNLRVVATPLNDKSYAVSVRGASFGKGDPGEDPSYKWTPPPQYPMDAVEAGAGGTVYLAALLNKNGQVEKADIQQVNLRFVANSGEMAAWRRELGNAALRAVRDWKFNVPVQIQPGQQQQWVVNIPINFVIGNGHSDAEYGNWDAYVPGPVQQIPWLPSDQQVTNSGADAIPAGLAFQADRRFVLLTPPGNG